MKYKVGDKVRIVRNDGSYHHFGVGTEAVVLEVDDHDSTVNCVAEGGLDQWVPQDNLVKLPGRETEEADPKFSKADLKDGMFCRLSDGSWFVIVGNLAVFDDGLFACMCELRDDLTWEFAGSIEVVLEGVNCFHEAKLQKGHTGRFVKYVRPGVEF